jgi:NAD(P)-dependent dehydrogenase (short-subunit alcohol dehydrogenase family)
MLLADKVVVISGVGPGLGRATALAAAREGAAVVMVARSEERLREVEDEITGSGGRALGVPASVTDPEACARVASAAVDAFGGIDVLVNSAFRSDTFEPFETVDLATWRKNFEVTFWGALNLTKACLPALRQRETAAIVNIGSMSARKVRANEGGYSAAKGALLTATKSLAVELAPQIRVNAVVPGWIWGPNVQTYVSWQVQARGVDEEEVISEITENIPLGVVPPQEDIAEAIIFLASDRARMITGQALDVNGGEWIP